MTTAFSSAVLPSDPVSCSKAGTGSGPLQTGHWGPQLTAQTQLSSRSEGVGGVPLGERALHLHGWVCSPRAGWQPPCSCQTPPGDSTGSPAGGPSPGGTRVLQSQQARPCRIPAPRTEASLHLILSVGWDSARSGLRLEPGVNLSLTGALNVASMVWGRRGPHPARAPLYERSLVWQHSAVMGNATWNL